MIQGLLYEIQGINSGLPQQANNNGFIIDPLSSHASTSPWAPEQPNPTINSLIPSEPTTTLWMDIPSDRKRAILLYHLATFHHSYTLNDPKASHLLSLTRVNIYRAFVNNMEALRVTWDWMGEESISPFPMLRPGCDSEEEERRLPVGLRPTELQRSRAHHPWIDFFPSPVMRDNLLRVLDEWDEEDLCTDIMGFWDGTSTGPCGLIVWGEPSVPGNWEVTEGFVRKWGWVVRGCEQFMRATNYWRKRRGEMPLFRVGM